MRNFGQLFLGLFVAAGIGLLVMAALSLALLEGGNPLAALPEVQLPTTTVPVSTPAPGETLLPTPSRPNVQTATPTLAQAAQSTRCPSPAGWEAYMVSSGDDLNTLAQKTGVSADQIVQANCLVSTSLLPGTILYLPHIEPTATMTIQGPTAVPCGPPPGWIRYTVQPGDNMFRLSQAFGVSVYQLQIANCMSGTFIRAGSRLFVPNVPTRVPPQTSTPEPTVTPTSTVTTPPETVTPPTPTLTHTPEPPTPTATDEPTETITPTITNTDLPPVPTVTETTPVPPPVESTPTATSETPL